MINTKQLNPEFVERQLKTLAASGPDYLETAQTILKETKAPFIIVAEDDGSFSIRSSYTAGELFLNKFLTVDPKTLAMKEDALKASRTLFEVLVRGETGTGKELIAKAQIGEKKGSIRAINCAAMPRDLIESELFGHAKGSFTGAVGEKDGLITAAAEGIMFLDEIGDLPLEHQAKLLRVMQERSLRKVGANKEEPVTCKFVFATNRDLYKMVEEKTFREDLYARIMALELHIEPLRNRSCDLILIAESLPGGKEFTAKYGEQLISGGLDLRFNVRSIQAYIRKYTVWGRL